MTKAMIDEQIRKEFVKREVLCEMTELVEFILDTDPMLEPPFSIEDVSSGDYPVCPYCSSANIEQISITDLPAIQKNEDGEYLCPICGSPWNDEYNAKACCASEEMDDICRCNDCGKVLPMHELDFEVYTSSLTWYVVTKWLAEELTSQDEVILKYNDLYFWGRDSQCDMPLHEDPSISLACKNAQILCGQMKSWEKYYAK